jgi:hypothetical protein
MIRRLATIVPIIVVLGAVPAVACEPVASVQFSEAAPKDIFTIKNRSTEWTLKQLTLDLTNSRGKMLFDTAVGGSGLDVAQPFERRAGSATLSAEPNILDGDTALDLRFNAFGPGGDFQFTIDVDDTLPSGAKGPTMIGGNELEGAMVRVTLQGPNGVSTNGIGRFGNSNEAMIELAVCG